MIFPSLLHSSWHTWGTPSGDWKCHTRSRRQPCFIHSSWWQDGLLPESQSPCHPVDYLICVQHTVWLVWSSGYKSWVWRHCLLYGPLENKHQSHTPARVTPRSSQGTHRSRAGKPGIEGLRLTRVHLMLCAVWWGVGGETEGGAEDREEEEFELTLITTVIMMIYLKKTEPPWPNHLPLLHMPALESRLVLFSTFELRGAH